MTKALRHTIAANRQGRPVALPSVCSAQPDVIAAALLLAQEKNAPLIIEATSNQVNQDGGYTGMRAGDFVRFVNDISKEHKVDPSRIIFGGDHLGPQVWRKAPAEQAMAQARILMAEYVRAGFRKIHLDCSEGCAGEPAQVDDATSAARAADLARICEDAADDPSELLYIVGTEVPPPGGARADQEDHGITPTEPARARATLQAHFTAFDAAGIPQAKSRICALVVQPGVEFAPHDVHHLPATGAQNLITALNGYDNICFEAHSTDYQHPQTYPRLAALGFAIQKVGPALTFAYRRGVYALDLALRGLPGAAVKFPAIPDVMENLMLANPAHWQNHYQGDAKELLLLRHHSYADRIRYYWPQPEAQSAIHDLTRAFDTANPPTSYLRQFFGLHVMERAETLRTDGFSPAKSILLAEVQTELAPYFFDANESGQP